MPSQNKNGSNELFLHQHRLIRYISFELIVVCALVGSFYAYKKLWYLVAVLGMGALLFLINLHFLKRNKNTPFCSHVLILVIFLTIFGANYLVWGIGSNYSYWFYIIPLLALASLVRWSGLIIYSTFAFLMILTCGAFSIPPFYILPTHTLAIIQWTNHLFVYLITVTIVVHLMFENQYYETVLQDKNHLLAVEKEKFQHLAHFDQLTNLPNRQYFKQHLQETMSSLATTHCITVFFMDLDNLKEVNDDFGHDVGDELLIQSAKRLQASFNKGDFVARLGGDEFTAIVSHKKNDNLPQTIAEKIIHSFTKPFRLDRKDYCSAISIGLANYPKDSQTVKGVMVKADKAMYAAKKIPGSSYTQATNPP